MPNRPNNSNNSNKANNLEDSLVIAALQDDTELKARIQQLGRNVIAKAEFILEHGNHTAQLTVMKNIMPAVVRALQQQEITNEVDTLREEMMTMLQEMNAKDTGVDDDDDDED